MIKINNRIQTLSFCLLFVINNMAFAQQEIRLRPNNWAHPIINSKLENFYKISEQLYRSEQPDDKAFVQLQKFGIKTVLNLRKHHSDDDEAKDTKIKLYHLKLAARNLTEKDLLDALTIINNSQEPILIHCWHGSDRTGVVAAAYRMVFQNWTSTQAIDEFINGGYGYHQWAFPNLVELLKSLDIKQMQKDLGIIKHTVNESIPSSANTLR